MEKQERDRQNKEVAFRLPLTATLHRYEWRERVFRFNKF